MKKNLLILSIGLIVLYALDLQAECVIKLEGKTIFRSKYLTEDECEKRKKTLKADTAEMTCPTKMSDIAERAHVALKRLPKDKRISLANAPFISESNLESQCLHHCEEGDTLAKTVLKIPVGTTEETLKKKNIISFCPCYCAAKGHPKAAKKLMELAKKSKLPY